VLRTRNPFSTCFILWVLFQMALLALQKWPGKELSRRRAKNGTSYNAFP
jgi:hypothetical protein